MRHFIDGFRSAWFIVLAFILLATAVSARQDGGTTLAVFTQRQELTLEQALEIALKNNPDLQTERKSLEMARQDIIRAKAKFDPYVQVDSSFSRSETPTSQAVFGQESETLSLNMSSGISTITGGSMSVDWRNRRQESDSTFSTLNPSYNTDLSLNLRQPLLKNGYLNARAMDLDQRKNDLEWAELALESKKLEVESQVEDAYWNLVRQAMDLDVRKQSLELALNLKRITQTQVDLGIAAPVAMTQTQANVASAQASMIRTENEYQQSQNNFKLILNLYGDDIWSIEIVPLDTPVYSEPDVDPTGVTAAALQNNFSLRQLQLNIANTGISNRQVKNRVMPQLDFRASLSFSGLAGEDDAQTQVMPTGFVIPNPLPTPQPYILEQTTYKSGEDESEGDYWDALDRMAEGDNMSWSAGLTFNVPVGNRSARSDWERAKLSLEKMLLDKQKSVRNVIFSMQNLLNEIDASHRSFGAAQLAASLQKQNLDTEEKKYEVGISTNYEVMQAQERYADAKTSEIGTLIEYNKVLGRLDRAQQGYLQTGGLGMSSLSGLGSMDLGALSGLPSGLDASALGGLSGQLPAGIDLNAIQAMGINIPF